MSRQINRLLIAILILIAGALILLASVLLGFSISVNSPSEEITTIAETEQDLESLATVQNQETLSEAEPEILTELEPESEQECEQDLGQESESTENQLRPIRNNFRAEEGLLTHAREVYYSIYFFEDGIWYYNGESGRMPAASVIKVYIMRYVYALIESGDISSDDFIAGQSVELLMRSMIQWSDNNATNVLIDYFGMESINQYLLEQGYTDTVLQRRMLDAEARNLGLDNYTSTRDAMEFLNRLYAHRYTFPYNEMLEIMLGQGINTKIPLLLPINVSVANKTGELPDVENDIGIVFTEDSAFAIVVLSRGVNNTEAMRRGIGQLALEAFEYMYFFE